MKATVPLLLASLFASPVLADVIICTTDRWCLAEDQEECQASRETLVILAVHNRLGLNPMAPQLAPEIIGPQSIIGGAPAPDFIAQMLPGIALPKNAAVMSDTAPMQFDPQTGAARVIAPATLQSPAQRLSQPLVTVEIAPDFTFFAEVDRAILPDLRYTGLCARGPE